MLSPNFKNLLNFINRPYYLNENPSYRFGISLGIAIFIVFILLWVKPMSIHLFTSNLASYSIKTGLICYIHFLLYLFVSTKLFPKFYNPEKWTIGRHALAVLILTIVVSISLWVFHHFFAEDELMKQVSYPRYFVLVLGVGFFPFMLYIFLDEKIGSYYRAKNSREIMEETNNLSKSLGEKLDERKIFYSTNKKETVETDLKNLVYITYESNYTSFFIRQENDVLKEHIIRSSLKCVVESLKNNSQFLHCHKSYIVNTNYVSEVSGNARGYNLHLADFELEIPVSRKFNKKELLQFI